LEDIADDPSRGSRFGDHQYDTANLRKKAGYGLFGAEIGNFGVKANWKRAPGDGSADY
jgi:hypothetical protein